MEKYALIVCLIVCRLIATGNETMFECILENQVSTGFDVLEDNPPKVKICKNNTIIEVSINALPAQLANGGIQLIDEDGDGYVTLANGCGMPVDCDDTNAAINPGAEEICDDGIDNNCNDLIDCEDEACTSQSICSACEVISQEFLDMMGEVAVGVFNGTGILRITTNGSFTRYSLQFYTSGISPTTNQTVVPQMRMSLIQFSSSSTYNYTLNGAFFDINGDFNFYVPGISDISTDGQFDSCAINILTFAQDNNLTIEYN